MIAAPFSVGSDAWRGARAAAVAAAFTSATAPTDSLLEALDALGRLEGGWLPWLARLRRSHESVGGRIVLLLPRPGDPRGLALPRGIHAAAAVGNQTEGGSCWLIPEPHGTWTALQLAGAALPHRDAAASLRDVRAQVVRAAHAVDLGDLEAGSPGWGQAGSPGQVSARDLESIVDSWLLGPPALNVRSRPLAALSLRVLLALAKVPTGSAQARLIDTAGLEMAARTGLEAAFSTVSASG